MREREINSVVALLLAWYGVFYGKCLNVGGLTIYGTTQTSESCRESELREDLQSPYGRYAC
jgi:hypothetical protein